MVAELEDLLLGAFFSPHEKDQKSHTSKSNHSDNQTLGNLQPSLPSSLILNGNVIPGLADIDAQTPTLCLHDLNARSTSVPPIFSHLVVFLFRKRRAVKPTPGSWSSLIVRRYPLRGVGVMVVSLSCGCARPDHPVGRQNLQQHYCTMQYSARGFCTSPVDRLNREHFGVGDGGPSW
jgi:hypothetical protein